MPPRIPYSEHQPTREEVGRWPGPVVLDFGTNWCGYCQGFAPKLEAGLRKFPDVNHVKVEDGPGRPLGRSFRVKLWPTLVFLRDGRVVKQVSRPGMEEVLEGLKGITEEDESVTPSPGDHGQEPSV